MATDDSQSIHALLLRRRSEDPDFRTFGASVHQYRLGPPLSEETVQAFEHKHHIALPNDYRRFLTEVGNAGAGPGLGLRPLDKMAECCDLSKPCPLIAPVGQTVQGIEEWEETDLWPGVLEISHAGCSCFSYLVVNGPSYGTVWETDLDVMKFVPTGLCFEPWYRRWLER